MKFNRKKLVLLSALVSAVSGVVYELLIAGLSSYLLGDSIRQFSITIGVFMLSFGIGSFLSEKFPDEKNALILVEFLLALVGGFSTLILLEVFIHSDFYSIVLYPVMVVIGVLVGMEMPFMGRISSGVQEVKKAWGNLLGFDYIGSTLGSVLFPLLLLPKFGLIGTAMLVGALNSVSGAVVVAAVKDDIGKSVWKAIGFVVLAVFLVIGSLNADSVQIALEKSLYDGRVIYIKQTPYQKLVFVDDDGEIKMFIDGSIQFSSFDEHRYHETLIHPAVSVLIERGIKPRKVLVLGGGDGLAVREILKYRSVKKVVLVDLDPEVVYLATNLPPLTNLNRRSLANPKVSVVNADAFVVVKRFEDFSVVKSAVPYDLVVVDLPDPHSPALSKLYSLEFYTYLKRLVSPESVCITQSTSPFDAPLSFWCINATLRKAGWFVKPMRCDVPSFGIWGFQMFSLTPLFIPGKLYVSGLKYLTDEVMKSAFVFPPDESKRNYAVNTIGNPVLSWLYEMDWVRD